MDTASLLIVDDNRLFREGLKRILCNRRFNIRNDVNSFVEALSLLQTEMIRFDLVVGNPVADQQREFEAIDAILQQFPDVKVVILVDRAATPRSEMALRNGVAGFLSKDISSEALRHSLELVLMGEAVMPITIGQRERCTPQSSPSGDRMEPDVDMPAAPTVRESEIHSAVSTVGMIEPQLQIPVGLSGRENQILKCLVNGLSNKLIARELDMAEATVKVHLRALLRKLKAQNRTQAAIWAMKNAPTLTRPMKHDIHHVGSETPTVKYDVLAAASAFNRLPM